MGGMDRTKEHGGKKFDREDKRDMKKAAGQEEGWRELWMKAEKQMDGGC